MQLVVRPAARRDIEAAYRWYRDRNQDVAKGFLDALHARFELIAASPELFPIVHRDVRRSLVGRFPYGIYYRYVDGVWRVIACTHLKRHPRRWQQRR